MLYILGDVLMIYLLMLKFQKYSNMLMIIDLFILFIIKTLPKDEKKLKVEQYIFFLFKTVYDIESSDLESTMHGMPTCKKYSTLNKERSKFNK